MKKAFTKWSTSTWLPLTEWVKFWISHSLPPFRAKLTQNVLWCPFHPPIVLQRIPGKPVEYANELNCLKIYTKASERERNRPLVLLILRPLATKMDSVRKTSPPRTAKSNYKPILFGKRKNYINPNWIDCS